MKQFSTPQKKSCYHHQQHEIRPQSGHDVIAVKQQRQRFWPLIAWNLVEPFHFRLSCAVDQETQNIVHNQRIIYGLLLFIGLPDENDSRPTLGAEKPFHARDCCGLMFRNVTTVKVSRRENLRCA